MQQHEAARLTQAKSVGCVCGKNLPVKAKANCKCRFHVYMVCTTTGIAETDSGALHLEGAHGSWGVGESSYAVGDKSLQAVNCRPTYEFFVTLHISPYVYQSNVVA